VCCIVVLLHIADAAYGLYLEEGAERFFAEGAQILPLGIGGDTVVTDVAGGGEGNGVGALLGDARVKGVAGERRGEAGFDGLVEHDEELAVEWGDGCIVGGSGLRVMDEGVEAEAAVRELGVGAGSGVGEEGGCGEAGGVRLEAGGVGGSLSAGECNGGGAFEDEVGQDQLCASGVGEEVGGGLDSRFSEVFGLLTVVLV